MTEFSVVIPAHNAAGTLNAALASVAMQTVPASEVVVVDDGSCDDTAAVARRWRSHLPLDVVVLRGTHGPGQARHAGVQCTTGPLLAFLDADDVWFPDHLELCDRARARRGGVIAARGIRWEPGIEFALVTPPGSGHPPTDTQLEWLVRHHSFGMHVLLPRAVYEGVGGFDPEMEGVEDWDLWIRVVRSGVLLSRTHRASFFYRQHATNLSRNVELVGHAGLRLLDRLDRDLRPEERHDLRGALRESRARIALKLAYHHLDQGDARAARTWGARALPGPAGIRLRGAGVAVAPRVTERVRASRRARRLHRATQSEPVAPSGPPRM
jgi:glycosyltransferase involved in cell wall biosynthesis